MDVALRQTQGLTPVFDIAIEDGDLVADESLQTAVTLSLYLDRRAKADDVLPDGTTDRRGWWADAWPSVEDDRIGSRLWLLWREKDLAEVRRLAEDYAREALAWLIDDRIAESVQAEADTLASGVLRLRITIRQGDGSDRHFQYVWEGR